MPDIMNQQHKYITHDDVLRRLAILNNLLRKYPHDWNLLPDLRQILQWHWAILGELVSLNHSEFIISKC